MVYNEHIWKPGPDLFHYHGRDSNDMYSMEYSGKGIHDYRAPFDNGYGHLR